MSSMPNNSFKPVEDRKGAAVSANGRPQSAALKGFRVSVWRRSLMPRVLGRVAMALNDPVEAERELERALNQFRFIASRL